MRASTWILLFATLTTLLWSAPAAAQGRVDVLKELVPPPRMILRAQEELGLTEKQKTQLKAAIKEAQTASLDLEFKVQEEAEKLAQLMGATPLNVEKTLAQADRLMVAENALKRVKLEMLLRTKKLLTAEQLTKIEEVQKTRRETRRERAQQRLKGRTE